MTQHASAETSPDGDRFLFRGAFLVILGVAIISLIQGIRLGFASFHHRRALDYLEAHQIDSALTQLDWALTWWSSHAEVNWLLARVAILQDRDTDGLAHLDFVDSDSERHPDALHARGRLAELRGDIATARTHYDNLHRLYPQLIAGALGLARTGNPTPLEEALGQLPQSAEDETSWRGIALMHMSDALGSNGYGTLHAAQSLWNARQLGANAVSLRVPGRQRSFADPHVAIDSEPLDGEHLRDIAANVRMARQLGFRVMLKPHVMLDTITETEWRGTLTYPPQSAQLQSWWQDYRRFIVAVATLANEQDVEALCVGVELWAMARDYPDRFRMLAREVRQHFGGSLTYAANWFEEYKEIAFWSDLDMVGIQFFFPLAESEVTPKIETLLQRVREVHPAIDELSWASGKPLLLTEVGYKSTADGLVQPWTWPDEGDPVDLESQRRAYRAILQGFEGRSDFSGLFWWNWLTDPEPDRRFDVDFTPQGKPAQQEIEAHWRQD